MNSLPYREGAMAYIFDASDRLLLVQLSSYADGEWNVPGGGREDDEGTLANALREIEEELGLKPDQLEHLGISNSSIKYDFPESMVKKREPIALKYRGQQKNQAVFRLKDSKADIAIDPSELKAFTWCKIEDLDQHLMFPGQYEGVASLIKEFKIDA